MRRARLVGRSFGRSLRRAAHNARRSCSALSLAPSAPVAHTGAEGNALAAGQGCRTGSAPGKKRTTLTAASQGTVVFCKQNLHLALRAPLTAGFQCGSEKRGLNQPLIPLETSQGFLLKRCIIKPIARKKNLILALNCCAIRLDKTIKKWYYNTRTAATVRKKKKTVLGKGRKRKGRFFSVQRNYNTAGGKSQDLGRQYHGRLAKMGRETCKKARYCR